jgi:hypothetical protein
LASFTTVSEEEFEQLELEADEADVVGLDDDNRALLEALKRQMEGK